MKRSQIILFSLFILITGGIYFQLKSNQKDQPKTFKEENKIVDVPVVSVKNDARTMTLVSYGQVSPNRELMVAFKIQGKLKKGALTMKPGVSFTKGQMLYELENLDAVYAFLARKAAFSNLLISAFPDIELDFPSELKKWQDFLVKLDDPLLPILPFFKTKKEQMFFTSRNITPEFLNLVSQEIKMEDYMYAAPFNGTVLDVYSEPGSIVNPGVQIAKIARTGEYEVKVPISMEDLDIYKDESSASFVDSDGTPLGTGKIIRVSNVVNQMTQSADVYYSIKPLEGKKVYNGMYVNVAINQQVTKETVVLPRTAIKDSKVNQLVNGKIEIIPVTILSSIQDSVYVSGIQDNAMIVINRLGSIDQEAVYKGVQR
jgi:hypothetical protein